MTGRDRTDGRTTAPPSPPIDWADVLPRHERWLRTVVRARLGEPQGVDEVWQEVALAAVAQRSPLSDPARISAWLYRLAVRQALLHRRRLGRRRKLEGRYADRLGADPSPDPLGPLLEEERRRLVREALDRLHPKDAEILMLKYTEDWSYRQLAGHLGLTEAAVEARLYRSRQRLRGELAASRAIEVDR